MSVGAGPCSRRTSIRLVLPRCFTLIMHVNLMFKYFILKFYFFDENIIKMFSNNFSCFPYVSPLII